MYNFLTLFLIAILFGSCSNQSLKEQEICPCADSLTDNSAGLTFYLDTTLTNIYAFRNNELLWRTNPRIDHPLQPYRHENPTIRYFEFVTWKDEEFIGISYTNSQFGNVNKETGEFLFLGQD